jgi:glycerol-3-phosphate dehydrogenase
VLVLPQPDGRVYVGLTDEPVDGPVPDVPQAPEKDVTFLLKVLNSVLETSIGRAQVAGTYAGLRPLPAAEGHTADLSRKHALLTSPNGVVTIVGGKLTTYRRMAEDAVDRVVSLGRLDAGPCRTARLPLVGATHEGSLAGGGALDIPEVPSAVLNAPTRLLERYGSEAGSVLALMVRDPELAEPGPTGVTGAELVWAVRHEGALDVADLLDRRTRIGLVPEDREAALPAARAALAY